MTTLRLAIVISAVRRGFQEFDKAGFSLKALGRAAKKASIELAALAAVEAIRFAVGAIKVFAEFENTIARATAVMAEQAEQLDLNGQLFADLSEKARQLGQDTVFTANEAGQALFFLGQAGLTAADSLTAVEDVLNLAQIGALGLGQAADIATDIMAGMRLGADDLNDIVDKLTKTFTSSNTTVAQLGTAFSKVGPIASQLGISIDEVAGAIGVLSSRGIKGIEAGTAIRNIFLRLLNPSAAAAEILNSVGLASEDVAAGMFTLEDILVTLKGALDSGAISVADIAKIFQARAAPAVLALTSSLDDAEKGFVGMTEAIEQSGGSAQEMVDFLSGTAAFKMAQFKAAVEGIKIELGAALAPVMMDMVDIFRENSDVFLELANIAKLLVPIFRFIVEVIRETRDGFNELLEPMRESGVIQEMVDIFADLNSRFGEGNAAVKGLAFIFKAFLIGVVVIAVAVAGLVDIVLKINDALLKLGVIGRIIRFVLTFLLNPIAALILFWDDLTAAVNGTINALKTVGSFLSDTKEKVSNFFGGGGFRTDEDIAAEGGDTPFDIIGRQSGLRDFVARKRQRITVHPGERVNIDNPLLGQDRIGAGAGGPMIGTINNNFHMTGNPSPNELVETTRKYIRRLKIGR